MNSASVWTLAEAEEALKLWKEAYKALASGQVKEYAIGTRKLTYLELKDILKQIDYFAEVIENIKNKKNRRNVRLAVPRDI